MKGTRRLIILTIITAILLLMAMAAESLYFSDQEYKFRTRRFNKILAEKEKIAEECLHELKLILANEEPNEPVVENNIFRIAEMNEITILEYIDKKLIHWSDNGFYVPEVLDDSLFARPIIFLQNGWFIPKAVEAGNEKIISLLRIRTEYGFENDIVRNGFEKDFRIPASVGLSTGKSDKGYNIYNKAGQFLFALSFPGEKTNTPLIIIPLLFWAVVILLIILATCEIVRIFVEKGKNYTGIITCLLFFILIYAGILFFKKPEVFFRTEMFSPYISSLNRVIPSLGHLFIFSILSVVFSYIFYLHFRPKRRLEEGSVKGYIFMTLIVATGALLVSFSHILFRQLVTDSNINFETYKVLDLNFFSILGFSSVVLLFLTPIFFILKTFRAYDKILKGDLILSSLASLLVVFAVLYRDSGSFPAVALLYLSLIFLISTGVRRKSGFFNLSVIFSMILGIYSLYIITVFSDKKVNENLKVQALSFSTENDPEAEHLLLDIWPDINSDTTLLRYMKVDLFQSSDFIEISDYLHMTYFTGYWGNFNINIYLCTQDQPLRIGQGNNKFEDCFSFFDERLKRYGHPLTGTGFYFIDNQGGRSYYLGRMFVEKPDKSVNGLFIELYSDVNVFQPGYSELLLDKKFHGYSGLKDYSFAKYINGNIVLSYGEFPYNNADDEYIDKNSDYMILTAEKFKHVAYRNGNATVIISRPSINAGNLLISFAYLFAFIFILANLLLLLIRRPGINRIVSLNFRQKLQVSFIGIILFSFLLIGIVVASLTIGEYRSNHYKNIKEKLNSVYAELENVISTEKTLSPDWRNLSYTSLNEMLIRMSNRFNTDINLYDLNGYLMATSRQEIFYRNLTSRRMNIRAFINVSDLTKSEYYQTEKVGNMKYISVYVPFYNSDNKILAYLNLPYFRMQSVLAREISNLIVAVMNFTLLLIVITMSLAVFISGRLTSPLAMLGEGLASVELGKKIEHLSYNGSDEIGELVKQYNMMVDELDASAKKLANSEREYAWREMAKQIAHEIKNPLTPMKLNVQQLLKSWKDKAPGFEEKLEVFTANQIENIDNLSTIASAFSSFAKMPGNNPMQVDLLEQIKTTLELFRNTDNISFQVQWPREKKVFIFADKEHLNGIFSNIFKNGIQAIPQERKGLIRVDLKVSGDRVVISIADNGTGIPEELKGKMFTPNFTTKSSGTGLGLSIVKKYIESAGGRIWFESEVDKGTVFHVEFPLMYTVEKPGRESTG